ncbi:DUF4105 domain-containing protein [Bdellovibrio sp. HCB2-146]|uniref:lipoprotein N-acyltransferase Lnb domain-containing protein n=1 Tax=Bdellovibrio sp. HCB2-146 TaxID=3394362 RepID=UPI0039BD0B70
MKTLTPSSILRASLPLVLTFLSSIAYPLDNGSCNFNPQDPHSPDARMIKGKYQGQCIDTSAKRSLKNLGQDSANEILVANYRKNGKFYTARIDLRKIQKVSIVAVDLNPAPLNKWGIITVSHTEMRMKFTDSEAIQLIPQDPSDTPLTDDDLIISFNYMAPPGVVYNPVKGFKDGLYGSVVQMFSTHDEANTRFVKQNLNVYEVDLNLNTEQAGRIIVSAVNTSEANGYNVNYNSYTRNCASELFLIIDKALDIKTRPFRLYPSYLTDAGFIPEVRALGKRKLIDPKSQVALVNKEFGYEQFPSDSNRYYNYFLGKTYQNIADLFKYSWHQP